MPIPPLGRHPLFHRLQRDAMRHDSNTSATLAQHQATGLPQNATGCNSPSTPAEEAARSGAAVVFSKSVSSCCISQRRPCELRPGQAVAASGIPRPITSVPRGRGLHKRQMSQRPGWRFSSEGARSLPPQERWALRLRQRFSSRVLEGRGRRAAAGEGEPTGCMDTPLVVSHIAHQAGGWEEQRTPR